MGSAAFCSSFTAPCKKEFSGTQYALLSSVMGLARTFLSSPSGFIVESLGMELFFCIINYIWFTRFNNYTVFDEAKISN